MTRVFISDLREQQQVSQLFRVADKQLRANRQGGKYILLKLADRTGVVTGMWWNADEVRFDAFAKGNYAQVEGRTQLFNGAIQIIVTSLIKVNDELVDAVDFQRFDSDQASELTERLRELLEGLENDHLRRLGEAFLADASFLESLQSSPAAVTNHHAYPGGLLRHTVDLMELACSVGPRYPQLDTELLMFGAFLHDLGKIEELAGEDDLSYTDRGQLVGHLVIGVQMLGNKIAQLAAEGHEVPADLRFQLEHFIVSHHGQLEYGSPRIPMTLEAVALHHLDNLDAKLAAATSVLEQDVGGDPRWTNYSPALGRKLWKPTGPNS